MASQIPTDIQEAKQIVERLSSAQVRAMFEAISAKKSSLNPDDIFATMDLDGGISVYICDAHNFIYCIQVSILHPQKIS